MIASSVDMLLECVPELRGRPAELVRALLPGPYTLVLPNPARRYPWLNGESLETIGVRVAGLPRAAQYVLDAVGAVAATSANDPGEPAAASLDDVPQRIRDRMGRRSTRARSPASRQLCSTSRAKSRGSSARAPGPSQMPWRGSLV